MENALVEIPSRSRRTMRTDEEKRLLVENQESSGLTVATYCKNIGFTQLSFIHGEKD